MADDGGEASRETPERNSTAPSANSREVRETWITGIGILSCLGEGADAHWRGLEQDQVNINRSYLPPYVIHALAPMSFDAQIPKKGDQRQMEPWQRIGTYAAGLALDSAGVKGNAEVLGRMDMIVAAGGGERDFTVDTPILRGLVKAQDRGRFLNERLMNDLRPTLFLAQLSNLLAGNISIVHGVTGSSRTFMGEEAAGVDAVRVAQARIAAGQSEIALVGGAQNAERTEMLLLYEFGGHSFKGEFAPVWQRLAHPGFALGSMGAFLVLENAAHARNRGAKPLGRLAAVRAGRSDRMTGAVTSALVQQWAAVAPRLRAGSLAVISGATGAAPSTAEERAFFEKHPELPVRATGTKLGHGVEPQFAMNIALAALAVTRGRLFTSNDPFERAMDSGLKQVVVTCVGHWRGEGLALLEAAQ
jgi:3-oxoacyl-[acyl-carrier-protein] synthase II